MQQHLMVSGHDLCRCGGYHYAHRPSSPCCEQNDWSDLGRAQRAGASPHEQLDIAAALAFELPGKPLKEWT